MSGPICAAFAVDCVALRAQGLKDLLPGSRIARMLMAELDHPGHDLLPLRIPLSTDPAERFFDSPARFAVIALDYLSEVIGIENSGRKFLIDHGVQNFARPRFPLHQKVNRQRLQLRRELRILREQSVRELWVLDPVRGRREPLRGTGRHRPPTADRECRSASGP